MTRCTCPSGDGSLRWPCPTHPLEVLEPMNTRKELRTSEAEWRTTPPIAHRPKAQKPVRTRTGWHILLLIMLAILYTFAFPVRAQVNTDFEALLVQQDRGWHSVGGNLQIQSSTLDDSALPIVAVWQRVPLPVGPGDDPYGQWFYVKVLYHCVDGAQVNYALIVDRRIQTITQMTGKAAPASFPVFGSPDGTAMRAVCSLYGYQL